MACCAWRKGKSSPPRALRQQAKPVNKPEKPAKQAAQKPLQGLRKLVGTATPAARKKPAPAAPKRAKASEGSQPKWRLFDVKAYQSIEPWSIPWGWKTTIGGTAAWAVAFVLIGILQIPLAIYGFHSPNMAKLTAVQQSQIMLIDQVLSTVVSVGLVRSIAKRWDTPPDFLRVSLRRPFAKPDGWAAWGLAGLLVAPPSILAANFVFELLPVTAARGSGTVGAVSGMVGSVDPVVFLNLLLVTGVLAPVLEETVFRGFLLPSLSSKMPVPAAVVASSAVFAVCHASLRDLPSLFALGVVMGFAYCRSRNLMTSIAIHGAWNSLTIAALYALVSSGVSIDDILAT